MQTDLIIINKNLQTLMQPSRNVATKKHGIKISPWLPLYATVI